MNELMAYVKALKTIIDRDHSKEMVFYDNGKWDSREHCRNLTIEELCQWALEISDKEEYYE